MLVLGVLHNFDSFVSDEEVGKKTAATARTTEFPKARPRYDPSIGCDSSSSQAEHIRLFIDFGEGGKDEKEE